MAVDVVVVDMVVDPRIGYKCVKHVLNRWAKSNSVDIDLHHQTHLGELVNMIAWKVRVKSDGMFPLYVFSCQDDVCLPCVQITFAGTQYFCPYILLNLV